MLLNNSLIFGDILKINSDLLLRIQQVLMFSATLSHHFKELL
jgi:superfamily II DNA/RNA helicase